MLIVGPYWMLGIGGDCGLGWGRSELDFIVGIACPTKMRGASSLSLLDKDQ